MTIAQQLKVTDFPFIIRNKDGNEIYYENSDGFWSKNEYDANGKEIYWEDSNGYWIKREFDANGNQIYCENSDGYIYDNRPKIVEVSLEEIAAKLGINVTQLRIKD
jgi:hypothetical protein